MAKRYGSSFSDSSYPDSVSDPIMEERRELVVAHCKLLNVRTAPSKETGKVMFTVSEGTRLVRLSDISGEWVHVRTTELKPSIGYVMRQYVEEI